MVNRDSNPRNFVNVLKEVALDAVNSFGFASIAPPA